MSLSAKINVLKRLSMDNSPAILTGLGVAGALSTAVLSFKAARHVDDALTSEDMKREHLPTELRGLSRKDSFRLTWQCYIPPVVACSVTVGSLIMVNRIGAKRAAALAAAVTISEKAFVDYKDKVVDILGEKEDERVRRAVAQDNVNDSPPNNSTLVIIGDNDVLFQDSYSGRYFMSTMETIRRAQNDINYQVNNDDIVPLSNFYAAIGLDDTSASDEVGWTPDKQLDIKFTPVSTPDGKPCFSIEFSVLPVRNYWRND